MAFHGGITIEKENMAEEDKTDPKKIREYLIGKDNQILQDKAEKWEKEWAENTCIPTGTFNLSEKINDFEVGEASKYLLTKKDVREFIRLLKEIILKEGRFIGIRDIDKLAGKSLC